jgi:D-arginine dehydrogenase
MRTADFLVIGGGIAGASAAYELAAHGSVALLEREPLPGHHTTGRSAAFLVESYGNAIVRLLTRGGRGLFDDTPAEFSPRPLIESNPVLYIGRDDQLDSLKLVLEEGRATGANLSELDVAEACKLCPVLREDYVAAAVVEPNAAHIDVAGLLDCYLRGFRARGGEIVTRAEVTAITPGRDGFQLVAGDETWSGGVVVNAAGAWCDVVGALAGVPPIGLRPLRRTAITFDGPPGVDTRGWACTIDADEAFYFKPEGAQLLASPCDETPMEPHDAAAGEYEIALVADRVQRATTLEIAHIRNSWAGLRSFVEDRGPVIGMDPELPGFFWLAGQGGFGIMTAPGASRAAASLIVSGTLPREFAALGLTPALLSPARLSVRS